jgi:DNA polymerase alpha subunit A
MSRRSLRAQKPSKNAQALERMRRQRAGEDISDDDSEDDDIFDVVDEKQYREIVRARRQQEDFVVDDDGTGYYDDGEEHLFDTSEDKDDKNEKTKHPQFRNQSSNKKSRNKSGALSIAAMQKAREAHREKLSAGSAGSRNIGAMFLGIKNNKPKKKHVSSSSSSSLAASSGGDFDLDSMLHDLVDGPQESESLASMSHVTKTPAVAVTGMKKRKVGDVLYGERLVDSPSGTVAKKKVARTNDLTDSSGIQADNKNEDISMGPPDATDDACNDDFGDDDVVMMTGDPTDSKAQDIAPVAAPVAAPADNKRSRFIEAQRKRQEERKRKHAEQQAAALERVQAAQAATQRAMAAQNASVCTTRGTGGWWDQSGEGQPETSSASSPSGANATRASDMVPRCLERAKDEDGDEYECLRMFFLDAYERQDRIYMFGKVWVPSDGHKTTKPGEGPGSYQSICVQVTGLERQLFFLPRNWENPSKVNKPALANEITKLLRNGPLNRNQSEALRMKMVTRNYAFELQGVPRTDAEYMKVKYSAKYGMLEQDVSGK